MKPGTLLYSSAFSMSAQHRSSAASGVRSHRADRQLQLLVVRPADLMSQGVPFA